MFNADKPAGGRTSCLKMSVCFGPSEKKKRKNKQIKELKVSKFGPGLTLL